MQVDVRVTDGYLKLDSLRELVENDEIEVDFG